MGKPRTYGLTPKETEVMEHIRLGLSSIDVGLAMRISKKTVDFHLANVFTKLDVNNRVQALKALGMVK